MKTIITYFILLAFFTSYSQNGIFVNGPNTSLFVGENSFLSIDGDFRNIDCDPVMQVRFNGGLILSHDFINNDSLKFTASSTANSKKCKITFYNSQSFFIAQSAIGGLAPARFWEVEINRGLGNQVSLSTDVYCSDTLNFQSGFLYLTGRKWHLKDPVGAVTVLNHPWIKNERNGTQFLGSWSADSGQVRYSTIYTASLNINPGNIGINFNGLLNIGSPLTIVRGCARQVNAAKGSLARYYDVYSPGHPLIGNIVQAKFMYNDIMYAAPGFFDLSAVKLYISPLADMDWTPFSSGVQTLSITVPPNLTGAITASMSDIRHPNMNVDSLAFRITVADPNCPNPPVSGLLLDTLHVCIGDSTLLDAGSTGFVPNAALRYSWNTNPPKYIRNWYAKPNNNYQKYKLQIMDARGCLTQDSVIIAPSAPFPQVRYFNHLNACQGDSVKIKDTVNITSGSYTNSWLFSDASSLSTNSQFFSKKFANTGRYTIQLTSTSNHNCSTIRTSTNVLVYSLPTASFESSYNCLTSQQTFTNFSTSNDSNLVITSNFWNLGVGMGTSNISSPSQTYTTSGTYSIMLRTSSSFGCRDSVTKTVTIFPRNIAGFSKNNVCFGDTVYFNNSTVCNTGPCATFWDFGDNTNSTSTNFKKIYNTEGFYLVKQIVRNSLACPDSAATVVFVNARPATQFTSSAASACPSELLYFTNTSSISAGSIAGYTWNYGNQSSSTNYNGVTSFANAGFFNIILTAISDSGCVQNAQLSTSIHPQPFAQYSVNDVCFGNSSQFVSTSSGNNLTYLWDFGNSVSTSGSGIFSYTYPLPGNYSSSLLITSAEGCTNIANVNTNVKPVPIAALGGSISTCGDSYVFDANNAGSIYFWQPGNQTTQTITVTGTGNYVVNIVAVNGCTSTESVYLKLNAVVKPNLGKDTIVCGGLTLDAGYPGSSYLWNTSAVTQKLSVDSTGQYAIGITDINSCQGWDTINIQVKPKPILNLGSDLNICKPKSGLILNAISTATNLIWNTGANTNSIVTSQPGNYWTKATGSNGCESYDSIKITFKATPSVNLGGNRSSCGSIFLDAQNFGQQCLWSNGATTSTNVAQTTSLYWVNVTHTLSNCVASDSANLIIHPNVTVSLGPDTTVCSNINFVLNAENSGNQFLWTTGNNTQEIKISSSGIYGVTVTNSGGCKASDYISVNVTGAPEVHFAQPVRYICGTKPLILKNQSDGIPAWGSDQKVTTNTDSFVVITPGKYWLTVNKNGCSSSDTLLVATTEQTIRAHFLASSQDTINKAVKFVNLSEPIPQSQTWYFGDGTTSFDPNPSHVFVSPVDYSVTLEVSNGYCTDQLTKSLKLLFKENANLNDKSSALELISFIVYPVPTHNEATIHLELTDYAYLQIELSDLSGRIIWKEALTQKDFYQRQIDLSELSQGIYFITLNAQSEKGIQRRCTKLIKTE